MSVEFITLTLLMTTKDKLKVYTNRALEVLFIMHFNNYTYEFIMNNHVMMIL